MHIGHHVELFFVFRDHQRLLQDGANAVTGKVLGIGMLVYLDQPAPRI